jgi:hypothetical protein
MQPNVLKECERVSQYSWIFTKLDKHLEIPFHEKDYDVDWAYF